ncbi:MAG: alpha/beta hydrolase [Halioglobus sp.]
MHIVKNWRILLFAVALTIGSLLLVALPWAAIAPVHIEIEMYPDDVGLAFEEFVVRSEDDQLNVAGWWMPAEEARASLVFIHGGGSSRHSTYFNSVPFYKELVTAGINVTAIDLRNHGQSEDHPSGMQFGLTEQYDALAAVSWTKKRAPSVPVFLMGISMGGATSIYAAANGADINGLILLDPLLDTQDVFARGATVQIPLPHWIFLPSAWSAQRFFGLPSGESEPLAKAEQLKLPILLMQDPDDPVTRALHSQTLAQSNPNVELWIAPKIPDDHPELKVREGWGTHVMAYFAYPKQTRARVLRFVDSIIGN